MHRASPASSLRTPSSRPGARAALRRGLAVVLSAASLAACAGAPAEGVQPAGTGPGYITRQHDVLEHLVGDFELAGWTQRDPFGVRLDFVGRATGRFVLDGLFAEVSIRGRLGDEDYEALYLVGYDVAEGRYEAQVLSSWATGIGAPASGRYDGATGELRLRHGSTPGIGGSSRGSETLLTFVDDDTWTLDRYELEWEPRRWSNLRASRVGHVEAEPEVVPPAAAGDVAPIQAGVDATR